VHVVVNHLYLRDAVPVMEMSPDGGSSPAQVYAANFDRAWMTPWVFQR